MAMSTSFAGLWKGKQVKHDGPGVLSMANSGPDSNGSQFLISLAACEALDGKNVAFGRATKGSLELLKRIEACGKPSGEPTVRVTILDCGEVSQEKTVKRPRLEVVTVLQLLRKHSGCKKASSWREPVISCGREEAAEVLRGFRDSLLQLSGSSRRAKFEALAREHSDCKSAKKGGLLAPRWAF